MRYEMANALLDGLSATYSVMGRGLDQTSPEDIGHISNLWMVPRTLNRAKAGSDPVHLMNKLAAKQKKP